MHEAEPGRYKAIRHPQYAAIRPTCIAANTTTAATQLCSRCYQQPACFGVVCWYQPICSTHLLVLRPQLQNVLTDCLLPVTCSTTGLQQAKIVLILIIKVKAGSLHFQQQPLLPIGKCLAGNATMGLSLRCMFDGPGRLPLAAAGAYRHDK